MTPDALFVRVRHITHTAHQYAVTTSVPCHLHMHLLTDVAFAGQITAVAPGSESSDYHRVESQSMLSAVGMHCTLQHSSLRPHLSPHLSPGRGSGVPAGVAMTAHKTDLMGIRTSTHASARPAQPHRQYFAQWPWPSNAIVRRRRAHVAHARTHSAPKRISRRQIG